MKNTLYATIDKHLLAAEKLQQLVAEGCNPKRVWYASAGRWGSLGWRSAAELDYSDPALFVEQITKSPERIVIGDKPEYVLAFDDDNTFHAPAGIMDTPTGPAFYWSSASSPEQVRKAKACLRRMLSVTLKTGVGISLDGVGPVLGLDEENANETPDA